MNIISEMAQIPDEALDSIVGGVLTEEVREQVRIITQQLKRIDISYKNAVEWWYQQTAGVSYSDEDHREIEEIVKSVYEE